MQPPRLPTPTLPTPCTLPSKICMHLLQRRTVKILQFYITTSFCVDIDHFNAKCRKLFLYISVFVFCCCCSLHFANATCRNELFFYIFTSCVVTYPTVRKHHFSQHLIWNFHENHIPLFAFFADSDIWVGLSMGYRESLWNLPLMCRRFQQSKV